MTTTAADETALQEYYREVGERLLRRLSSHRTWGKNTWLHGPHACLGTALAAADGRRITFEMQHFERQQQLTAITPGLLQRVTGIIHAGWPERIGKKTKMPMRNNMTHVLVLIEFNDHPDTVYKDVRTVAEKLRAG
jgi:hypothetical protein